MPFQISLGYFQCLCQGAITGVIDRKLQALIFIKVYANLTQDAIGSGVV
ncbi:hypothetical protein H6F61_19315 [Cyanobacteria bacterium FACHB-472]|nr:hypothetical protein [Cyanobacteria bacterium FACHB-472]